MPTRVGLVLGAGGVVGHVFHAGVLAALAEKTGWDPRTAEIIVGTSAGSRVAALLRAGVSASDLAAVAAGDAPSAEGARLYALLGTQSPLPTPSLGRLLSNMPSMSAPRLLASAARRPFGFRPAILLAAALPAGTVPTEPIATSIRPLFGSRWPERRLWICAVSLDEGKRVVFGQAGAPAAEVASAVAASCAIPGFFEPVVIDDTRYVDGGTYSPTNLDLLAGERLDLIVVSSPMSTARGVVRVALDFPSRVLCRLRLAEEAAKVRRSGTLVVTFEPTAADQNTMGLNAMDPGRRRPVVLQTKDSILRRLERTELREQLSALAR